MGKMLNTHGENDDFVKDLKIYLQRPFVYFCFGIPLFIPSVLLILLASLQEGLDPFFIAMGSICLIVAIATLCVGGVMAYHDRMRTFRALERGKSMARLEKSSSDNSSNLQSSRTSSTQNMTISSNQRTNSNSSLNSTGKGNMINDSANNNALLVTILSNTDKTKLVKLKQKAARSKRGARFPVIRPLPSLEEEDHTSHGHYNHVENDTKSNNDNNNNTNNNTNPLKSDNRRPQGAVKGDNIKQLEGYLSVIGLGGNVADEENHPQASSVDIDRRCTSRSFDENELSREKLNVDPRKTPLTSRDVTTTSPALSPRKDFPRLVTVSHERTGLRAGPY